MKRVAILLGLVVSVLFVCGQGFNNNYQKSYINIDMPKTPESQAFEKYGTTPVDENSGVPNISVPLYNVRGRFLEIPISLSYHASGIKVNQEASWVGLGFDINCGGRITVETKGNIDYNMKLYTDQQDFKTGLQRLFNKWKSVYDQSPNGMKMGYAFIDYGKILGYTEPHSELHVSGTGGTTSLFLVDYHTNDTLWDDNFTVSKAAWYGIGEPDIYHANFNGNSVDFYFDLIDGSVHMIGEKSNYDISAVVDNSGEILSFMIIDQNGVKYNFETRERTKRTAPTNPAFNCNS